MDSKLSQQEVDNKEWGDDNNWTTIYFSKKDSRSWVPKRNPKHGSTINFGSPGGAKYIYYLYLFFTALGFGFGLIFGSVFFGGG